jgi:NTP pyrophosphatase (non-canonical NTP hydrolase)
MNDHTKDGLLTSIMTLEQIQSYMLLMAEKRGFTQDPAIVSMLILTEEIGELAKALRKHTGIKIDHKRLASYGNLSHEMADVFICLVMLANKCNINLFDALKAKEEINNTRMWSQDKPTQHNQ